MKSNEPETSLPVDWILYLEYMFWGNCAVYFFFASFATDSSRLNTKESLKYIPIYATVRSVNEEPISETVCSSLPPNLCILQCIVFSCYNSVQQFHID